MKMNQFIQWVVEQQPHSNSLLYLVLFFILFIIFVKRFSRSETNKCRPPPSPSKLPIIGNLHQIRGSAHHAFKSLAQKHGPLILLHLGSKPTLVVSSAEIALEMMKTYDHVFSSRPQLQFPTRLFYGKDIAAFAPYGEYWRQLRKVCVLQLLNSKKVQSFRFVREEEIASMVDKIKDSSFSTSAVNLSEMFISLTKDVVCRVAFGKKYNEGELGKKFKDILKEFVYYLAGVSNIGDLIPSLAWVNNLNGLNARVEKNFRDVDSFMNQVVEEHIEKKRRLGGHGSNDNEEEDFVDVMLGIENGDNDHVISWDRVNTKAMILDTLVAGTDTSAVVLEWAMSELIRHPNVMKEVQKEVRDIARRKLTINETDINEMHYLKSLIKETLRLHPPSPLLLPRESMQKVQIQGYDIPAKTLVMINVFDIGRNPKLWNEPEKFWPKRFMNGASVSIDFKGQDFQFIPFGARRRGCPGVAFAISNIELALANLLNRFDWTLPEGMNWKDFDMEEESGIIVHRKNELVLIAKLHYS